jgi:Holliday junction resolvase RusA-like endonuclease
MSAALSFEVVGKPVTQGSKEWARVEGPVVVEVAFTFDRPRKALRSGKYWQVTRSSGVVDHLVRVVIESFTAAGVWRDASNVVDVRATKLTVGDEGALSVPGARIVVRVVGSTS